MTEHVVYESAVKQIAHNEDKLELLRHGLRELKVNAVAQSLHDGNGNAARAAFARFESAIEQLLTIAGVLLLVLLTATPTAAAPDPVGGPNSLTLISGPNTFQDTAGQWFTAFMYRLDPGTPEPSHLVLDLCTARVAEVVGWATWEITANDPTTGAHGLKLDGLRFESGQPLTFSVVLRGQFTSAAMPYTIKAGQQTINGSSWGPRCNSNAVQLRDLRAGSDLWSWLRGLFR